MNGLFDTDSEIELAIDKLNKRFNLVGHEIGYIFEFFTLSKGMKLGMCQMLSERKFNIYIHADLFKPENHAKLRNTLIHELTHALVHIVFHKKRYQAHGKEFYYFGKWLFNEKLERCADGQQIKVTPARKMARFAYELPCNNILELTSGQHKKLQTGAARFAYKGTVIKKEYFKGQV